MRAVLGLFLTIMMAAGPAIAQDLPGRREAMRLIHPADSAVESIVFPHPSLNAAEVELLSGIIAQGVMPQMTFYGAIAIAPDEGLADPNTTTAVGNFHDTESATVAALDRCNAARDPENAECAIVLIVQPAEWEPGAPLQLSSGAAEALRVDFRRATRPRVFAISDATGQFGIGFDVDAAVAACGVADCRAVVADN